jgi:CHAD domain-containing protein
VKPGQDVLSRHHRLLARLSDLVTEVADVLPAVLDDSDPEALHAMRVALRRFVALFRLGPEAPRSSPLHRCRRDLAAIVKLGGPRRDLDIVIDWLRETRVSDEDAVVVGRLLHELARRRATEQRRLRRRLESRRFRDGLDAWPSLTEGILAATSVESKWPSTTDLIDCSWQRLRRHLASIGEDSRFRRLHRLRKEVRTLRYLLEFVAAGDAPGQVEAFIRELRRAQDALGEICDLRARRMIIRRVAASVSDKGVVDLAQRLARGLRKREHRARNDCPRSLNRLLELDPPI